MVVTHADIRALKYCNRGARIFFERNGLDWNDFRKNGVSFETLEAIGDGMGLAAIAEAKRRYSREAGV